MLPKPRLRSVLPVVLFGLALTAGVAVAGDNKLDQAKVSTAKAIQLLREAEDAGADRARDAHRKKAIDLLTRAQGEILKANGGE